MDDAMSQADVDEIIELKLEKLPGWCTVQKGKRMSELARGASLVVELGVFGARGLCAMALTLADQGHGRADGIDPYTVSAAIEGVNAPENDSWWSQLDYEAVAHAAQTGICSLGLYHCARLVRLNSREAVRYYSDESIDLLHLDANHSEATSTEDVALWAPKIRPSGYWVFDDTNWESTKKARLELEALGFTEREDHDTWKVYQALP